ncbi:MAG TPA: DUF4388 domain-containing protein [Candidatus Obscuribacterales bacterium]
MVDIQSRADGAQHNTSYFFERTRSYTISSLLVVTAIFIASLVADAIAQELLLPLHARRSAEELALMTKNELFSHGPLTWQEPYSASWCYLTDKSGSLDDKTAAFAPVLKQYATESSRVNIDGRGYYEAVVPFGKGGELLHLGFGNRSMVSHVISGDLQDGFIWLVLTQGAAIIGLIACAHVMILRPLRDLSALLNVAHDATLPGDTICDAAERLFVAKEVRDVALSIKPIYSLAQEEAKRRKTDTSQSLGESVVNYVMSRFSGNFRAAACLKAGTNEVKVIVSRGLDERCLKVIAGLNPRTPGVSMLLSSGHPADFGLGSMENLGLSLLARLVGSERFLAFPIILDGKVQFTMLLAVSPDMPPGRPEMAVVGHVVGKYLNEYESDQTNLKEISACWSDALTGSLTPAFLRDQLKDLFESSGLAEQKTDPFSVLAISVSLDHIADSAGRERAIKHFAQLLKKHLRSVGTLTELSRFTDYLIRYTSHSFVVILGWADGGSAQSVATRIQESISGSSEAQKFGILEPPCIGYTSVSDNNQGLESIVASAFFALRFAEKERGAGSIVNAADVPMGYQVKDSGSEMSGELGVLSGYGLLQSLALNKKSGELRVHGNGNAALHMLWEQGRPLHVKYGELNGKDALVEFLVTCQQGKFTFKEKEVSRLSTSIRKDAPYLMLDRCLMDAALAEDHMAQAKKVFTTEDRLAVSITRQNLERLALASAECTQEEIQVMEQMVAIADNDTSVSELFDQLGAIPTALKWRAAWLLNEAAVIKPNRG